MREINISIIVPVYNGAATLPQCLQALNRCKDDSTEILVIDDRCTDASPDLARSLGATVFPNTHLRGPAGARNEGADHAAGGLLLFVDADVVVPENTLRLIRDRFSANPEADALFGSYDLEPAEPNFLSQYKNLFHHYVHQQSLEDSSSFWAGCGAIRKSRFHAMGGFNEKEYPNASIEDIDLGHRLALGGSRILLVKELQVKHLKKWTPRGLLKADILLRAIPWTRLLAQAGRLPNDLNLQTSQRISAVLAWGFAVGMILLVLARVLPLPASWIAGVTALCGCGVVLLNLDFYRFFARRRGGFFTFKVFFWHVLYFLYSSAVFGLCYPYYAWARKPSGK